MKKILGALCVMLLVSGCASVATLDKTAHVSAAVRSKAQTFVQMQARVSKVAYRLATRGTALCSNVGSRNPLQLYSAKAAGGLSSGALTAMYQLYGLDNHIRAINVLAGAPIIDGALARGDRITSIAGQTVDDDDPAGAMRSLQSAVAAGKRFDVVVAQADGGQRTVHITPEKGCDGQVVVLATRGATTDVIDYGGDVVGLPADLVKYFKSDDALAYLVGRQLYFLGTSASTGRKAAAYTGAALNGVMRFFTLGLGNVVVNLSHTGVSLARDAGASSADAFALRIMRASGYDVRTVPKLWQRIDEMLAKKRPDNATLTPSAERRTAVEQAIVNADAQAKASADAR